MKIKITYYINSSRNAVNATLESKIEIFEIDDNRYVNTIDLVAKKWETLEKQVNYRISKAQEYVNHLREFEKTKPHDKVVKI